MRTHSIRLIVPAVLSICGTLLALGAPAHAAGDGTPFLMKVGTGGGTLLPPANADSPYTNMMSVSITPKRSGICTVTGAFRIPPESNAPLQIVLSRATDTAGTGAQVYDNPGRSISGAISDAFVVQRNVPVTFFMNGRNLGTTNVHSENKHLWVICEQERTPTLP
ncbi:MAG TPA: hypothetical protein VFD92_22895 [Candidatus Binatia bacterium]|nr:hypothetical protein [Candidatus Binatia bacterium]